MESFPNIEAAKLLAAIIQRAKDAGETFVTVSDVGAVADSSAGGFTVTMDNGNQFDVRVRLSQ